MTVHDPETATNSMKQTGKSTFNLATEEVRQGDSRLSTTSILIGSLILAAFVWIGAEIYGALVQDENFMTDNAVPATSVPVTGAKP